MKTSLSPWFNGLFHLIFPDLCLACRHQIHVADDVFCMHCMLNLPLTRHEREPENTFIKHFKSRFEICSGAAMFYLNRGSGVEKMLYLLKYGKRPDIGYKLGLFYGRILRDIEKYRMMDAIVPVPLHPEKRSKRGYNQSEQFAKGISRAIDVPVRTDLLQRVKFTTTQTSMTRAQRIRNTSGAFIANEALKSRNYRILLVDDVLTTGATFEGCIQALVQKNEKTEIHLITIAMGHSL